MKIEIRTANVAISPTLEAHIERRIAFALRRFGSCIDHEAIIVRLVDLNGPKGGPDKRCRITTRITAATKKHSPFTVLVEATDADAYVAVSQAAARLGAQIARVLRRQNAHVGSTIRVLRPESPPQGPEAPEPPMAS